jgi:hypothetical protein
LNILALQLLDALFWCGQILWHGSTQALDGVPYFASNLVMRNASYWRCLYPLPDHVLTFGWSGWRGKY